MMRPLLEQEAGRAERLQGQPCSQVSIGEADTLIIDFGELRSIESDELSGELTLVIECPWRLDDAELPRCGWQDDDEHAVTQLSQLIGVMVEAVEVRRPGYDLILSLAGGHTLRLFPDLRAYYSNDETTGPWYVTGESRPEAPVVRQLPS